MVGRVHLPSLAAELPEGWTVSEEATLRSPSGTEIHLKLGRVPEGWTAAAVADDLESATRAAFSAVNGTTSKTVVLRSGVVGDDRRLEFDRDGAAWVARLVGSVDGGLALTVRASWPATNGEADGELDLAVTGLRLLTHPLPLSPSVTQAVAAPPSRKRSPVDASRWAQLRACWATSVSDGGTSGQPTRWSAAELAVFATILGSSSFPTVGVELLASLPEAALTPTLEWVTRSLLARRLIEPAADGTTKICADLEIVMEVAVFPDLTIFVERFDPHGATRVWFGVRPDRAVQIAAPIDGSRECALLDPAEVVSRIHDGLTTPDGTGQLDSEADVVALTRITTAWRAGELIRGGTFAVAAGADGAVAFADPSADSTGWQLRLTDAAGVHATLLEHLPGG